MPRSRRRAGVKKGKTLRQMTLARRHQRRLDQQAAHEAKLRRLADERRAKLAAAADKYANYPGNR